MTSIVSLHVDENNITFYTLHKATEWVNSLIRYQRSYQHDWGVDNKLDKYQCGTKSKNLRNKVRIRTKLKS